MTVSLTPAENSAQRYQQVRRVFDQLLEIPVALRQQALSDLSLSDEERSLVQRLLDGHAKQRLFVQSASDWASDLDGDDYIEAMVGKRIGGCELIRLIGRGGSSVVYYAQRTIGDTTQGVAVKLLNSGLLSAEAQRRFRREQEILSRFTHPNIARLIDAGISDAGLPYIVMEYVEGSDIVRYAALNDSTRRERIHLLIDTCRAIDAAHRDLVVHRDLKPSNVLVTTDGVVKVLDFGIAKLIDDGFAETATHHVVLTPAYAAPEQFRSGPAATSMDVYSLGVLASELLLGGRLGADATLPANESSATWQQWRRMEKDLAHVLRAALSSEPKRRYSSAGHMADDLVRYLNREPLQVVPISHWYRARKFVSRHRTLVSAAAFIGLALLLGIAGVAYQWRNARHQAELARRQEGIAHEQAERAQAIRDFLVSIFDAGNAEAPRDKQPSVEDIVVDAGKRLQNDDKLTPSLKADLLLTLADVAGNVGAYDRSDQLLDEVDRIKEKTDNQRDIDLRVRLDRAGNLIAQSSSTTKANDALALLAPVLPDILERRDEIGLAGSENYARALLIAGRQDEALAVAHATVGRFQTNAAARLTLKAMAVELGIAVACQHYREAQVFSKAATQFWSEHGSPVNPTMMEMWGDTAIAREFDGDSAGAEQAYRKAIEISETIFAHPTIDAASWREIFGTFLLGQARMDEAETQIRQSLQMVQSIYGADDPRIAQTVYGMARLYGKRENLPEAIKWASRTIELSRKEGHTQLLARSLTLRAQYESETKDFSAADRDIRDALDEEKALSGENSAGYFWVMESAAEIQIREHRYDLALQTCDRILEFGNKQGSMLQQNAIGVHFKRAQALAALEKPRDALAELDTIAPQIEKFAPRSHQRFKIAALRATLLADLSRMAEAKDAASAALQLPTADQSDPSTLAQLRALLDGRKLASAAKISGKS